MKTVRVFLVLAAALAFAAPAWAASTIIAGPGSYGVGATTSAAEPDLAGTIIADRLQPFTINGADGGLATGAIQERVVKSDVTGFLHFYHRVTFDTISGSILAAISSGSTLIRSPRGTRLRLAGARTAWALRPRVPTTWPAAARAGSTSTCSISIRPTPGSGPNSTTLRPTPPTSP